MIMDQIMNYVKPELLVLAVVLYFVGVGMKKTEAIADKYIPVSLGGLGILLCGIWVVACNAFEPFVIRMQSPLRFYRIWQSWPC